MHPMKSATSDPVSLSRYLTPDDIYFIEQTDKSSVLTVLFEKLRCDWSGGNKAAVYRELCAREELMPTGIGCGVALPHVASKGIKSVRITCAIAKAGIGWDAFDGMPVTIVFLFAFPLSERTLYLRLVARLSSILKDPGLRSAILRANGNTEVHSIIMDLQK